MKCQLSPFFQEDRLTFIYLYHLGTRTYQLQNEPDSSQVANFYLFSQANANNSETLENLEYTLFK